VSSSDESSDCCEDEEEEEDVEEESVAMANENCSLSIFSPGRFDCMSSQMLPIDQLCSIVTACCWVSWRQSMSLIISGMLAESAALKQLIVVVVIAAVIHARVFIDLITRHKLSGAKALRYTLLEYV
jgi:hypothetical protein